MVCSQVAVPDLLLTATYSAAMLLALPWVLRRDARFLPGVSALLGLAVLAKGPAPLILAAPLLVPWSRSRTPRRAAGWLDGREFLRLRVVLPFLIVAVPWYALCTARNGHGVPRGFFLETQRGAVSDGQRVATRAAILVLRANCFGRPAAVDSAGGGSGQQSPADRLRLFLLAWVGLVLVFFLASANKLPGYILPLALVAAALLGMALGEASKAGPWLAACAVLLIAFPAGRAHAPRRGFNRVSSRAVAAFRVVLDAAGACGHGGVGAGAPWAAPRRGVMHRRRRRARNGVAQAQRRACFGSGRLSPPAPCGARFRPSAPPSASSGCRALSKHRLDVQLFGTPLPECAAEWRPIWVSQLAGQPQRLTVKR